MSRHSNVKNISLEDVTSKNECVMLGFDKCSYCDNAISLFKQNNVEFTYVPVNDKAHLRNVIKDKYKHSTLPCIFYKKKFIGGYDDLVKYYGIK
ncbi:hypothetical protein BDAP_001849 [Binucleata daphniae]